VRRAEIALGLLAALALLALLPACQRRPQFTPAGADSIRGNVDSFTVFAREASDRWESGMNEEAAALSARAAHEAIRLRPNAPWAERVRGVLDSLGIGAEVSGDEHAMVANLFSRTDPEGESWPYLFWRESDGARMQPIDGHGMHLGEVALRGYGPGPMPSDTAQFAILWGRRVSGGQQPLLMTLQHARGGRWDLLQTLGPDSLGGTGTGEFSTSDSPPELTIRSYRPTPHFDECATCPHVFHQRRYAWASDGFHREDDRLVPSPYSTFAAFISALIADDRDRALPLVVDRSLIDFARHLDWQVASRGRWRVAPASDETGIEMIFFRGADDAFRVRFEAREGDWVIAGFESTSRTVE
jgi:hypothetical protein